MKKKAVNFHPQVDLSIGDKYLLKEFIDEGSFGYVWKAVNLENRQTVALKIPKDQERETTPYRKEKNSSEVITQMLFLYTGWDV